MNVQVTLLFAKSLVWLCSVPDCIGFAGYLGLYFVVKRIKQATISERIDPGCSSIGWCSLVWFPFPWSQFGHDERRIWTSTSSIVWVRNVWSQWNACQFTSAYAFDARWWVKSNVPGRVSPSNHQFAARLRSGRTVLRVRYWSSPSVSAPESIRVECLFVAHRVQLSIRLSHTEIIVARVHQSGIL